MGRRDESQGPTEAFPKDGTVATNTTNVSMAPRSTEVTPHPLSCGCSECTGGAFDIPPNVWVAVSPNEGDDATAWVDRNVSRKGHDSEVIAEVYGSPDGNSAYENALRIARLLNEDENHQSRQNKALSSDVEERLRTEVRTTHQRVHETNVTGEALWTELLKLAGEVWEQGASNHLARCREVFGDVNPETGIGQTYTVWGKDGAWDGDAPACGITSPRSPSEGRQDDELVTRLIANNRAMRENVGAQNKAMAAHQGARDALIGHVIGTVPAARG